MADPLIIGVAGLQRLLDVLNEDHTVVGPVVRDGAIVLGEVSGVDDLPRGVGDEQEPGRYRLHRRGDDALFGFAALAQPWKRLLFPPAEQILATSSDGDRFTAEPSDATPPKPYALLGVRGCDLAALRVHDTVLLSRRFTDGQYAQRRAGAFIVAVSCGDPVSTCFCISMGSGPRPGPGYDLSLTELLDGPHRFLVEAGSERGQEVAGQLAGQPAGEPDMAASEAVTRRAADRMGRSMDTTGIRDLLYANAEHPRWDDVASRCLSCGNCTMACPTCFCATVQDTGSLDGSHGGRHRLWDSCFTGEFSYIHGGSVRASPRSRYRQWMTHKLASWHDQFGTSGCVGCGRCIAWCPVGIDITEEVAAIRADPLPVPDPEEE